MQVQYTTIGQHSGNGGDKMSIKADFSHDFPVPKGCGLQCVNGHLTFKILLQSPLRCGDCGETTVLWKHLKKPWLRPSEVMKIPIPTKGWDGNHYRPFRSMGL